MRDKLIIAVLAVLVLLSIYKNYQQAVEASKTKARIEALSKVSKAQTIVKRYVDKDTVEHVVYKEVLVANNAEKTLATNAYIDTLSDRTGVSVSKFVELTRVKAIVHDTVKVLVSDSAKFKRYSYENKWLKAVVDTKDSTLKYQYKIELVESKYYTGNWLLGKTYYRDVSIADTNASIYGVQRFTMQSQKTKRFGLGLQVGYTTTNLSDYKPYIGLGISYNLISF